MVILLNEILKKNWLVVVVETINSWYIGSQLQELVHPSLFERAQIISLYNLNIMLVLKIIELKTMQGSVVYFTRSTCKFIKDVMCFIQTKNASSIIIVHLQCYKFKIQIVGYAKVGTIGLYNYISNTLKTTILHFGIKT